MAVTAQILIDYAFQRRDQLGRAEVMYGAADVVETQTKVQFVDRDSALIVFELDRDDFAEMARRIGA